MKAIKTILFLSAILAGVSMQTHGSPGDLDLSFDVGSAPDFGYFSSIAVQLDGKILVGGNFSTIQGAARTNLVRLTSDGILDTNFLTGMVGPNGQVSGIFQQPQDGKILIWGNFTAINGISRNGIARLNMDGSVDLSFFPTFSETYSISSAAQQSDGKIIVGGSFRTVNGVNQTNLARFNLSGSFDTNFVSALGGLNPYVSGLKVQRDDRILIGGFFTSINGLSRTNLARLHRDGEIDASFLAVLPHIADRIAVQTDGRIVAGMSYYSNDPLPGEWCSVMRLNANGAVDGSFTISSGFNSGSRVSLYSLTLQGDDKIIFGGIFGTVNGVPRTDIARLNADGTLDSTFDVLLTGAPFHPTLSQISLQPDGRILLVGFFTAVNNVSRNLAARLVGGPYFLEVGTPLSQTVERDTVAQIEIEATGYTIPTYQWFFNENLLQDQTNAVLEITQASPSNSGSYKVIVTNSAGTITSAPAMLNVIPPVERRIVPAVKLLAPPEAWSTWNMQIPCRLQSGSLLRISR